MARLTISLLGSPRIEVDGVPIAVDTRKAVALLAYLAVTGERKSRDTLASFLWPDYDSEHARAALRRTLSALGKGLGGEFLEIDRTAIALDPADAWLDVADFRRFAAEGQDAEAAELYRGDFLAGFGLRDSLEFDDWQFFEAETLKRDFAGVLERLARVEAAAGRFDGAVELTRRWLALDELQEPAHRLLMELYARSGQRSAALRAVSGVRPRARERARGRTARGDDGAGRGDQGERRTGRLAPTHDSARPGKPGLPGAARSSPGGSRGRTARAR